MSHSYHAKSARKRRREELLERDDQGAKPLDLLKLQEQSLKKLGAKDTEQWKRAAAKVGALRYHKFVYTSKGWDFSMQKTRGLVSDVPGEAPPPPKPNQIITAQRASRVAD